MQYYCAEQQELVQNLALPPLGEEAGSEGEEVILEASRGAVALLLAGVEQKGVPTWEGRQ